MTPSMTAWPPTRVVSSPLSRIGISWVWVKRRKYVRRDTDPLRFHYTSRSVRAWIRIRIFGYRSATALAASPPVTPDARRVDQGHAAAHLRGEDAGLRDIQNRHHLQHHREQRDARGRARANLQPTRRMLPLQAAPQHHGEQ